MMALSKRQLAMLREIGVRVWQPTAPAAPTALEGAPVSAAEADKPATLIATDSSATDSGAARAHIHAATEAFTAKKPTFQAPQTPTVNPPPVTASSSSAAPLDAWQIGSLQTLYTEAATPQTPRWLLLLEAPAAALASDFNPFGGDAGKLLDNLLRAAKLHTTATLTLLPLVRSSASAAGLASQLASVLASAQPDVVVVMGRLAAQALLQSSEPLAKLRGQIHSLPGSPASIKTIITIDPAYLLRNPLDKAKAWEDVCLAISAVSAS